MNNFINKHSDHTEANLLLCALTCYIRGPVLVYKQKNG